MPLKTQAATEIARFLANHPTPEQRIIQLLNKSLLSIPLLR